MFSSIVAKHIPHANCDQKSDGDVGGERKTEQGSVPDLEDVCEGAVNLFRLGEVNCLGEATD